MRFIVALIVSFIHVNATAQITTTIPSTCEIEINPSYTIVVWKQSQQFSATLIGACNEPCYRWEVPTSIGSTIDSNGLYTAGMGNEVAEQITVTDDCNSGISATATVQVLRTPDLVTTIPTSSSSIPEPSSPGVIEIGDGSGVPGSSENVIEVNLDNPSEKVLAITLLDICDVDDYLSCASCESTERSSGLTCLVSEQEDGCMSVWLRDFFDDNLIEEGNGPILTISCDISSSALPGECRDLNPGNGYIANELDIYVDVIVESGEFCFLSEGTVIIDGCDTEVTDREIEEDLTMSDLIEECANNADGNHGKFTSCVASLTNEWKKDGLLNGKEKGAIQSCVAQSDIDSDGILNSEDNCPYHPNGFDLGTCILGKIGKICRDDEKCGKNGLCSMNQEDSYPPQGNGIGDACECEGDFDGDGDQDASDALKFKKAFGRSSISDPCIKDNSCTGDFDVDQDCDGADAVLFKQDFGRCSLNNPCPACVVEER